MVGTHAARAPELHRYRIQDDRAACHWAHSSRKLAFPCGHVRVLLVLTDDDAARGLDFVPLAELGVTAHSTSRRSECKRPRARFAAREDARASPACVCTGWKVGAPERETVRVLLIDGLSSA